MYPIIPGIVLIENHEEIIKLSNQFNAAPVFAGIILTYVTIMKKSFPIHGSSYIAEFTGLKAF